MGSVKKLGIAVLSTSILLGAAMVNDVSYAEASKLAESKELPVIINGVPLMSDKPVLLDGRKRYLPLRAVLEQLGWKVEWEPGLITISYRTLDEGQTSYLWLKEEDLIRSVNGTSYIEMYRLGDVSDTNVSWSDTDSGIVITAAEENDDVYGEEDEELPELTEEESRKVNYGQYEESPTLDAIINIYSELEQEGYDPGVWLGFYPDRGHSGYSGTPLDVVAFGRTGSDGEHFGFLTDFGSVDNLEEAPIVMVSPMNFDEPAIVVADNIRDFLRIALIDTSLLYLNFDNERQYLDEMAEYAPDGYVESEEEIENMRVARERLGAIAGLPSIADPYTYSAKVRVKRSKQVILDTESGLGVTNKHLSDAGREHSRIVLDEYISVKELSAFLEKATYASKLALIRDFHLHLETYVYKEEVIEELIVEEMGRMGLQDEIARMEANRYR
ncbi:hypothetical protein [Paenibacillus agaridevorans]|nr:hypothetical protein [Paenibacillus agaridevorans]